MRCATQLTLRGVELPPWASCVGIGKAGKDRAKLASKCEALMVGRRRLDATGPLTIKHALRRAVG